MQINKPPSTPTSGVPATGSSGSSSASDKASRSDNPLAQLVGQVVSAQVLLSKAVQIASAKASLLQAGVAARLTAQRDQKAQASPQTTSNSTSTTTSTTTSGSTTSSTTTPAATATNTAPPTQTQYQTTLQIGNERVVVVSDQPLPPGVQVMLKVSSPQAIQLVEQPAMTPPPAAPDIAGNLLNTLLRQALPLQQPVANLLATIANDLLLFNDRNTATTVTGNTNNPLAASGINLPPTLPPAVAAVLKPLLSQIINGQLSVDNITEPDVLRSAVTNSGLFREARLVQWAQALLKQFPGLLTQGTPSAPGNVSAAVTSPLSGSAQTTTPPGTALPGSALAQAVASALAQQTAVAATPLSSGTVPQTPLVQSPATPQPGQPAAAATNATLDTTQILEAKQTEILRNTTSTSGAALPTSLQNAAIDNQRATLNDVDALRNELLKALSAKAQKNQPAFATQTTNAAVTEAVETGSSRVVAAATTTTGNTIPVNAKTATPALPIDTGIGADTKTTLEKLVSTTSRQLLEKAGRTTSNPIDEEQVLAILRQLPVTQELQAATARGKPQNDDDQWLLQLLRSSFGALKHLQLQQATNLNASPSAQNTGMDNPVAPLQIELPILVAQQWHSVNIEIDRRAPDNRPDANKGERSWRVTLRFELPQLGVIVTQLNLSGVHVNATLWAEKQATCAQLQHQLKELSDRLGKVGAHVTTLDVRHGQPPSAKTRIEQRLIDVRT